MTYSEIKNNSSWSNFAENLDSRNLVLVQTDDFFEKDIFDKELYERKSSIHVSRTSTLPNDDTEEIKTVKIDKEGGESNCFSNSTKTSCSTSKSKSSMSNNSENDSAAISISKDIVLGANEEAEKQEVVIEIEKDNENFGNDILFINDCNGKVLDMNHLFGLASEMTDISKTSTLSSRKNSESSDKKEESFTQDLEENSKKTQPNSIHKSVIETEKSIGLKDKDSTEVVTDTLNNKLISNISNEEITKANNNTITSSLNNNSITNSISAISKVDETAILNKLNDKTKFIIKEKELITVSEVKSNLINTNSHSETTTTNRRKNNLKELLEDTSHIEIRQEIAEIKSYDSPNTESISYHGKNGNRKHKFKTHLTESNINTISESTKKSDSELTYNNYSKASSSIRKNSYADMKSSSYYNSNNNNKKYNRSRVYSNADKEFKEIVKKVKLTNEDNNSIVEDYFGAEPQLSSTQKTNSASKDKNSSSTISNLNNKDLALIRESLKDRDTSSQKPYWKDNSPSVGVGIIIVDQKRERLLLGRRIDSGLYGLPGGWIEFGEEWEETAARELKEETGINKTDASFKHIYTLNYYNHDKTFHSCSCVMYTSVEDKDLMELDNKEPNKCYGWFWISLSEMRSMLNQLFPPLREFIKKYPNIKKASEFKTYFKAKIDLDSLFENECLDL